MYRKITKKSEKHMEKRRENDRFFRNKLEEKYAGSGYNIDIKTKRTAKTKKTTRSVQRDCCISIQIALSYIIFRKEGFAMTTVLTALIIVMPLVATVLSHSNHAAPVTRTSRNTYDYR